MPRGLGETWINLDFLWQAHVTQLGVHKISCTFSFTCLHLQMNESHKRIKSRWQDDEVNDDDDDDAGADLGGGCRGCAPPPPEMTCGFLIQLVFCKKKNYVVYWCWSKARDECTPPKKNPGSAPVMMMMMMMMMITMTATMMMAIKIIMLLKK